MWSGPTGLSPPASVHPEPGLGSPSTFSRKVCIITSNDKGTGQESSHQGQGQQGQVICPPLPEPWFEPVCGSATYQLGGFEQVT